MAVMREFREFALKGSVADLAIGVIIGAAFGKIVDSLVKDILMPPLGLITGGVDFTNQFITLKGVHAATLAEAQAAGAVTINYGVFLNTLLGFLIIAFCIFLMVKKLNAMRREMEPPVVVVAATRACPECMSDIPVDAKRCKYCAVSMSTPSPAAVPLSS